MAVFYFLNIILIVLLVILALAAMWGIYRKRRKMSIAALKEGVGYVKKKAPGGCPFNTAFSRSILRGSLCEFS